MALVAADKCAEYSVLNSLSVIILFILTDQSNAFITTITEDMCENMIPTRNTLPYPLPSPYKILTNKRKIRKDEKIKVIIKARKDTPFKGFYLQARNYIGNPIGTFYEAENVSLTNCSDLWINNMAIHSNFEEKYKIRLNWSLPIETTTIINFHLTVIKDSNEYWLHQKSKGVFMYANETEDRLISMTFGRR